MQNFLKIAEGINTQPLLQELFQHPALWDAIPARTACPESPHAGTRDILVRFEPLGAPLPLSFHEWYPAATLLPEAQRLALALCAQVGSDQLGRVVIAELTPGQEVPEHADVGLHPLHYTTFRFWSRYHLVLQTDPAVIFHCGGEHVHMQRGDVWQFRNDLPHAVTWAGPGRQERLHMIVDIHTIHDPVRPL